MPLRIKLPQHERIMINGAVIENAGDNASLVIHNTADILRRKEIMQDYEANTPARRIYYALQCAYIFKNKRNNFLVSAKDYILQYLEAAASAKTILSKITKEVDDDLLYKALKTSRLLIEHECVRLDAINSSSSSSKLIKKPNDKPKNNSTILAKTKNAEQALPISRLQKMEAIIGKALNIKYLYIDNLSSNHLNHPGDDGSGETHYKITLTSPDFVGSTKIQNHRKVLNLLKDEFNTGLHACELVLSNS